MSTETGGEPRTLRGAALAVVREWNAGSRAGMGFTPMWGAMENLVAALIEAEAATPPLDVERLALLLHYERTSNDEPVFDMDEARRRAANIIRRLSDSKEESGE